ncbi:MAG: LuxR C-terminal-related transcriptional regulator [Bacteroidota bacterium]
MLIRLTITTFFLFFTTTFFSQNVDSLILLSDNQKGKTKATTLNKIGLYFYDKDFTKKAKEYFNHSLAVAENVQDTMGMMNAYKGLLRTAYHKEDSVGLSIEYAAYLEDLSVDFGDKPHQAYVLHHYGRANRENFNRSVERLKRALDIYTELEKKESAHIVNKELGQLLLDSFPDQALIHFQKSLGLAEELGNEKDIHLARSNMSSAFIAMKQFETARKFCERNIELAEASDDQDFLALNHLLIGVSYKNEGKLPKAIESAMKGKAICEANDLVDKKQFTYQLLKEIYNERGNITEAFEFFKKEKQVEAEIEKRRAAKELANTNAQYALDTERQEFESEKQINYYKNLAKNALLVLLGIVAIILYMFNVRRNLKVQLQKEELEKLRVEQMLEQEERERLKERLEYKERELASNTMFMLQKNKMLTDLKEKISSLKVTNDAQLRKQVKSLDRNIDLNMNFDDDWQKFKLHFEEVHPNFFEKLLRTNPSLTTNETRFCAYIRMGLSTKEIAQLMAISAGSVQKARYRLKKKLGLGKEVNLIEFIANL